jgi:hypothetical protein
VTTPTVGFFTGVRDESVWWMFWSGIYVDPKDSSAFASHYQLYIILTLFVIEKMLQRWLHNRNGCTMEKIREFKVIDEKMKLVKLIRESEATNKISNNTEKKA